MGLRVPCSLNWGDVMVFKLLTALLAVVVAAETFFILTHSHPANRFKSVGGYDGVVAFDTATGQLCKTLRTKSATQIELEVQAAKSAKEKEPCPRLRLLQVIQSWMRSGLLA